MVRDRLGIGVLLRISGTTIISVMAVGSEEEQGLRLVGDEQDRYAGSLREMYF